MSKDESHKPKANKPKADPQLAELEQQVARLTEALQHERADSMNLRRRHEEQISGLRNMVKASVVRDLLPVMDNIERALKHLPKELDTKWDLADEPREWVKGVKKILEQFEKTLEHLGVERIKTVGEPFDPVLHEAVSMEEGDGSDEVVSEELQAGYRLGDEVIRHAMVRVTLQ